MAVHPHRRGERHLLLARQFTSGGSSPQAWGTASPTRPSVHVGRFIPTGVGNGVLAGVERVGVPVHPHRRGERVSTVRDRGRSNRFIPTGVGNGWPPARSPGCRTVHPHRRGERAHSPPFVKTWGGSSPQAWGTVVVYWCDNRVGRFIPTGVGNGEASTAPPDYQSVHPHRRGERGHGRRKSRAGRGSSPQAWGTAFFFWQRFGKFRFIPTGVGNGATRATGTIAFAVHPHRRGERSVKMQERIAAHGSSPQAWGTAKNDPLASRIVRFIPPGVGNGLNKTLGNYSFFKEQSKLPI